MKRVAAPNDFLAGLFFIAVAGVGMWLLREVRLGTSMRMGPGYLPTALCYLLLAVGLWMTGRSLFVSGPPLERWYLRPLVFVLGAVLVFALGVEKLGLFVAIVIVAIVAALATPESRWKEVVVVALALAAFSTALFVFALGLQLAPWPQFTGF